MQVQKYDCYSDGCFGVFRVEAFALAASETSLNISYRYAIGGRLCEFSSGLAVQHQNCINNSGNSLPECQVN